MLNQSKQEILQESLFQIDDLNSLNFTKMKEILIKNKFVAIRGLILPEKVQYALNKIRINFTKKMIIPLWENHPTKLKIIFKKFP
ncbi:MAG: hypothetical protein IGQ45_11580 [Cyanobacterium sp. T60_A2020_053]|nr:hypothetical protein [Cyanobacterium sp. T60_A2020_053]